MRELSHNEIIALPYGTQLRFVKADGNVDFKCHVQDLILDFCDMTFGTKSLRFPINQFSMFAPTFAADKISVFKVVNNSPFKLLLSAVDSSVTPRCVQGVDFYLTGSRYFGGYTDTSDYDYFTEDTQSTAKLLEEHGFRKLGFTDYKDELTSSVYRVEIDGKRIDIQLVKDVRLKIRAQQILSSVFYKNLYTGLAKNKTQVDKLWNLAFAMCQGMTLQDIMKAHC